MAITDRGSAEAWLKGKPQAVQVAFAARCALRALPGIGPAETATLGDIALPVMRAILTSGVAAVQPTPEVRSAARSARSAARSADSAARSADSAARSADSAARSARSADSAAYSAARSADSAAYSADSAADSAYSAARSAYSAAYSAARSADSAAYSAADDDATRLDELVPESPFKLPLWPTADRLLDESGNVLADESGNALFGSSRPGMPNGLAVALATLRTFWNAEPEVWGFWARWYDGMLNGEPLPWGLQEQVALIPDEDWEKGAERVAEVIREIEAAYLAKRLPQAERVEFNPETEKFRSVPCPVESPDLLAATLSQVEDALDDALANPSNGLTERSRETRVIRRVIAKYGNDPQRIEMDLVSVAQGLRRQMDETDELPRTEENRALQGAVEQTALGVRAAHPEIAANREILAQQSLRELSPEDKDLLADAAPLLAAISEEAMSQDFATDIPELINDAIGPVPRNAPPLPGVTRTFSRVSKMRMAYDALVNKGASAFDSKTVKTVRFGLTVGRVLSALVGLGLRILGIF